MRKINKSPNVPATLQSASVPTCASEVSRDIYRADDVRAQLMTDQARKCAYCESRVTESYNDVEHYRPKNKYYWLGHAWDNLLYSCAICNRSYKKHNFPLRDETAQDIAHQDISNEEPLIINPTTEEPSEHIKFRGAIAVGLSDKGVATISMFHLNDREDLKEDRKQLFEEYERLIKIKKCLEHFLHSGVSELDKVEAQKALDLCNNSITNKLDFTTPYSGMIISQI